jgi:hypothetical protein
MAAQLLARMALEAMRAGEKVTPSLPDADSPSLAILDALASPTWDVVCRSDGDATEAAGALPRNSLPAVQHALRNRASISLQDAWSDELTAQLYSRALGCVARNSLWVQIPNAAVFYLSAFDEALATGDKACKRALPAVCALIERVRNRRAELGLGRRPAPRAVDRRRVGRAGSRRFTAGHAIRWRRFAGVPQQHKHAAAGRVVGTQREGRQVRGHAAWAC